ncbi:MAG: hypothetical protein [Podoviridae sp. ctviO18]|nr:MAG: hypothetical protein [Podoviridae sp. ctviO18]
MKNNIDILIQFVLYVVFISVLGAFWAWILS